MSDMTLLRLLHLLTMPLFQALVELPASLAPLDDSAISTNKSAAGFVSVDDSTGHPTVGGLPASLTPLNDSDIAINHSAASYVSIASVAVPSPDDVGMVILTVPPASLDPITDTTADRHAFPAVLVAVDVIPATGHGVTNGLSSRMTLLPKRLFNFT